MYDLASPPSEKRLARQVFERVLQAELSEILAEFKARAAPAGTSDEMRAVRGFLAAKPREI